MTGLSYCLLSAIAICKVYSTKVEPCVPFISEISNLTFGNTRNLQFIELQVPESCRQNRKAMQQMSFSDYGLLILNTKSKEKGGDSFEMETFVKFSKSLWPKAHHDVNARKGGRRVADEFRAFFVVGGPKDLAPSVTATDRVGEAITWDMYTGDVGLKCGSLLNWPNCENEMPRGQGTLDKFLCKSSSSCAVLPASEKDVLEGQIVIILLKMDHEKRKEEAEFFSREFSYVQFDANKNKQFVPEKLQITKEKQEWLSSRIVDIVVLSISMSPSLVLPISRLEHLLGAHVNEVLITILPADLDAPQAGQSISRCPSGHYAVTKQTPGTDNVCDNDSEYMLSLTFQDLCNSQARALAQIAHTPEHMPMDMDDIDEMYESHSHVIMDGDADIASTSDAAAPRPLHSFCKTFSHKQDKQQITLERLLQRADRLQEGVCTVDARVRQVHNDMIVKEELRKSTEQLSLLQLQKKFGMDLDPEMKAKLQSLENIGIVFTEAQKKKYGELPWLQVAPDASDLRNTFMRCKICNRDQNLKDDASWFQHCAKDTKQVGGKASNSMGLGKVFCIKREENYCDGWSAGIARAIRRHAQSKEHTDAVKMYHMALGAQQHENQNLAIDATITATLSAYTIAKEGLPLTSQFPLMMFALRTGANVGRAHYEATTAKRMIKNFAVHIEYELFKYLIANDLPFSILMDGSSSSRGTKWMAYMIRTITPSFEPYTFHLLLAEMGRETGQIITDVLLTHFTELNSWVQSPGLEISPHEHAIKRLVAITTDGASTMTGSNEGVFGRLRKHIQLQSSSPARSDLLLSVCAAHKLNLAMKNANHIAYTLARALIMEMHTIFGSPQSSSAKRHYKETARLMSFKHLHMGQFFAIRWSDSFKRGLSNVIRMWPVLIESLRKVNDDGKISENLRTRAKYALWVMQDGRVLLMMKYVFGALDKVSSLSLLFQNTDSLAVDAMEATRASSQCFIDGSLINKVTHELTAYNAIIKTYDGKQLHRLDEHILSNYYDKLEHSQSSRQWRLVYVPKNFKDFAESDDGDLTNDEKEMRSTLTSFKIFTSSEENLSDDDFASTYELESSSLHFQQDASPDLDPDVSLNFGLGSTYRKFLSELDEKSVKEEAEILYSKTYASFSQRMEEGIGIPDNLFVAVDRHIILDIIDFSGNFRTEWNTYIPSGATLPNRGYPAYMGTNNEYDTSRRADLINESIEMLENYCVVSKLKESLFSFYATLHTKVANLEEFPKDLRNDKTSKRLYKKLLEFREQLDMPEEVELVLKCVLVIPSSNADTERTFSTANRLTAGERNSLSTKTINTVMHIQRNGPNLLTLEPAHLAYQWIHPLPGLNLKSGLHSTKGSSTNTMATIQNAFYAKNLGGSTALDAVVNSEINVETLLNVFGDQAIRASLRSKSDVEAFRKDLIAVEKAKATIFSIGVVPDNQK